MSDVFSFGVVLLELLTGRRSVDKSRRGRQQNLVEFARPFLKDPNKLERIIDPRLEGQYSYRGARKAASLAYQCLSHNPRNRPTMTNIVKILESLVDLNDIPSGPFVYVVPTDGKIHSAGEQKRIESKDDHEKSNSEGDFDGLISNIEMRNENEEVKKEIIKSRRRGFFKVLRHRHRIKPWRSRDFYSDTDLYRKLGSSLYAPKSINKKI